MTGTEPAALGTRMVRGGAVTLLGSVASRLVSAVAAVVLARVLGIEGFAVLTFGAAYATFFSTIADLGVDTVAIRDLAARPEERDLTLGSALAAKSVTLVASLGIGTGVALLYDGDLRLAALIGAVTVLQALAGTYGLVLTAAVQMAAPTAIRTVGLVATWVGALAVALAGGGPVLVLGVQAAIGFLPGLALLALVRRRVAMAPRASWARTKELLGEALPVAAAAFAIVVFARVDQLLLGAFGDAEGLAAYGAVVRLVDLLNFAPVAVITVVLPAVSSLASTDPERIRRLTLRANRYLASVALPAGAVATVAGGPVLGIVFGAGFDDAGAVLAVLLWAHAFAFAFLVSRQVLVGSGRAGELARVAWVAAIVDVVLSVALIPTHSALGAAVASLVAYSAPVAIHIARRDRDHPFALAGRAMLRPGAAALVVLLIAAAVERVAGPAAAVIVGVGVSPVALLSTGAVRLHDVRELAGAARSGGSGR